MTEAWTTRIPTALLVLADGTVIEGDGLGATGIVEGEVCFNTALTGYQEILTDPSYSRQIVTFTFPHIGNTGTNDEDLESLDAAPASGVRGAVIASAVTNPSSWRSSSHLDAWLKARGIVGIVGRDAVAGQVIEALRRLEYRGYDSAGIATLEHGRLERRRASGKLVNLEARLAQEPLTGTIGTGPAGVGVPTPRDSRCAITPSAAASPKADPPVSTIAWARGTVASGRSRSVSRVPGAAPRTSTEATAPASGSSTTVQPVRATGSLQWPTRTPATPTSTPLTAGPRPRDRRHGGAGGSAG